MRARPIDRIMNKYFDGEITLKQADEEIAEYLAVRKFDEAVIRRLDRRKDAPGKRGRTYAEFFRDISEGIRKEHATFLAWVKYMESKKINVKWEKYGTDAIGLAFIENSDDRPDYLISLNNSPFYAVDVKTCPVTSFNTFKKGDLKNYIKHNSSMLVCMGKIDMKNPELKAFSFYGNVAVKYLNNIEGEEFYEFAPNKKAVRISFKNKMKQKRARVSFEELTNRKIIDYIKITKGALKAQGPLNKWLRNDFTF